MLHPMTTPLDRPIWHALTKRQAGFAVGGGLARRFDPGVSPLIACEDDGDAALGADAGLLDGGGVGVILPWKTRGGRARASGHAAKLVEGPLRQP